jgi:hypothetical protein
MRNMKTYILAALFVVALTSCARKGDNTPAQAGPPAATPSATATPVAAVTGASKEEDIRRMLQLTGAGEVGEQMMDQMLMGLRQSMREVPQNVWDEIISEFRVEFAADRLIEMSVPIYARHFSHDEIRQLIAFYESPAGRKLADATPQIAQESYRVGVEHGENVMRNVLQRLQSRGYKPPAAF